MSDDGWVGLAKGTTVLGQGRREWQLYIDRKGATCKRCGRLLKVVLFERPGRAWPAARIGLQVRQCHPCNPVIAAEPRRPRRQCQVPSIRPPCDGLHIAQSASLLFRCSLPCSALPCTVVHSIPRAEQ